MVLLISWIIGFNRYLIFEPNRYKLRRHFIIPIFLQVFFIPLLFINTYIRSELFLKISKLRPEYDGDDLRVQLDGLTKSELESCMYTMLYVLIHIIIVMILIVVLTLLLPQRHFKIGFYFTIAQSFLLVFWIIQFNKMFIYGSKVDQIRQQFIFTIFAQVVAIPLLFGTTYICSQVFLKVSKLHPEYEGDNLYEVIYGGDDSSTKKIDIS
ncbi:hypothetical protein GCK72_021482 [Caenorhabditis remanei]|uniref:Uncharacterized protein n=1 Tax=Caenorhabditis remanei TaxID=31234 RepID=A0A6A5GI99_CAERE|nr:hypothetical protein GCK72_021482 [Caenorhabditis remanei]KAF1754917.1 hypothetical protein GCK72_021482 [Caenorhabditis remanei]